jgi:FdhD protein
MRTPGQDVELAHGFLLTEGVIGSVEDVVAAQYCGSRDDGGHHTYNVLDLTLAPGVAPPSHDLDRNFYTTSSCGVCGKASLDAVRLRSRFFPAEDPADVSPQTLFALPEALRSAQRLFDSTGGLHAAGLFSVDGDLLVVREDVGRHNAVDKVLGWALLNDHIPARGCVLMVSGRASFELVQKAVMAGVPVLAAVSAPSSLAVELADESGMTLVGFLRGTTLNIYAGAERIMEASAMHD